jgi:DNA-binding NarL/FixJ family response regulator
VHELLQLQREFAAEHAGVVEGLSNDEIAGRLGISPKTVESHLRRLFERHGMASRTELATRALRDGWLEVPPGS